MYHSTHKRTAFQALLLFIIWWTPASAQEQRRYIIDNVTVIPMNSETSLASQKVLIGNGKILAMGRNLASNLYSGATIVDGTGKFLIPGLFDMHAHFLYEQGENVNTCEDELKIMLFNGLTTVRLACGDPLYLEARKSIQQGALKGPELIVTSPQLVGEWTSPGKVLAGIADTPLRGAELVRQYKAEGYDQIKLTTLIKPDVYDVIVQTAKQENIKVVGHVGPLVKLPRALAAKQQVEHMDEFIDMLLPDTSFNHGQSVSDMNLWRKKAWATVPHLDESKIPALVNSVRQAGIYVTPTNYFFSSFFAHGIDEEHEKKKIQYQYIPPGFKDYASKVVAHYQKNLPPYESRMRYIGIRNKMIVELWKAGVPLMAGSDSPQWYTVTGFALHDELENLVNAGLTPFAALQTATISPATFLEMEKKTGTIEAGKEADLLLLEGNPLEDIRNTRMIWAMFSNGEYFSNEDLKKLREDALRLGR